MMADIVLLPSYAHAEYARKRMAQHASDALLGQTVTTFDAWLADLWELHGDGRAFVDAPMRRMLMRRALLEEGEGAHGAPTAGLVEAAAECMRRAAGTDQLVSALEGCTGSPAVGADGAKEALSVGERFLLEALARYEGMLAQRGLIEPGQAVRLLAEGASRVFARPLEVVMEQAAPLDWHQQLLFSADGAPRPDIRLAPGAAGIGRAPEGVQLRFGFPSGPTAQAGLVADIVRQSLATASDAPVAGPASAHASAPSAEAALFCPVIVTCADPLALHRAVAPALARAGASVAVQGRIPFGCTDFGRAFLSMYRCLHEDPWDCAALTDVLLTSFSGFSQRDAYEIDRRLRRDRIIGREEAIAPLRAASEPFSQLEELASDPDADILVGAFEQMVQAQPGRSAAWRAEQLAALSALRRTTTAARAAGLSIRACFEELERTPLPVSSTVTVSPDGAAVQPGESAVDILITSQADAVAFGAWSCRVLIAADLTSDAYPVADPDDATATLLSKLGLEPVDDALAQERRRFASLLGLPTEALWLIRPLNDAQAAKAYPSLALEELIDAYRSDPSAEDDIKNIFRLPVDLQEGLLERSEESLFENAVAQPLGARQELVRVPAQPQEPSRVRPPALLARRDFDGRLLAHACPSPSAIEAYLECPGRWLIERRLRVETPDEGFGPLERGSFAHEALQTFYQRFQAQGNAKVTAANLEAARELMRTVLAELTADQPLREPGSGRAVPATELERRDLADLGRQLIGFLDFESRLLTSFQPAYFEFAIDPAHAVDYAGFKLTGVVDRIDVDDVGHAVIIDYKGSLGTDYALADKTPIDAGKVQTRIYARAVERALGLRTVGALYLSYGRSPQVLGAYDPRVLDSAQLPGIRPDACACRGGDDAAGWIELTEDAVLQNLAFPAMLDATERIVGGAIARMQAGETTPASSSPAICRYCVAPACPKRGGAR